MTTYYTVIASSAATASQRTSDNTTDDWACGRITRDELPRIIEGAGGRDFEWDADNPLLATATFDEEWDAVVYDYVTFELVPVDDEDGLIYAAA